MTVYFVKEGINTDGDGYKFILTILGAVAEMEIENTVERVQQGVLKLELPKLVGGLVGKKRKLKICQKSLKNIISRWLIKSEKQLDKYCTYGKSNNYSADSNQHEFGQMSKVIKKRCKYCLGRIFL